MRSIFVYCYSLSRLMKDLSDKDTKLFGKTPSRGSGKSGRNHHSVFVDERIIRRIVYTTFKPIAQK